MACSLSGLDALYDAVNGGGDVWINENRFRILKQIGEGGFAYVYLMKEIGSESSSSGGSFRKKLKDPSLISDDGTYAMKKVLIQNNDQLNLVKQEVPLCAGLKHMHSYDPAYAHNDVKPGNVLITHREGQPARPARKQIRSRYEALQLQEWAAEHCSAPFRAPELWDCPSHTDIDERTDIWSLGCTLYAIMYGMSPFEYALGESGGSLQLAIMNAQVKWPAGPKPPYPEAPHQFVTWML
ncbi:hypothetical protein MKX01_038214 [Papaver californicum]|nr:hypothetical protein MKX01_038214 [Papaver californicum]